LCSQRRFQLGCCWKKLKMVPHQRQCKHQQDIISRSSSTQDRTVAAAYERSLERDPETYLQMNATADNAMVGSILYGESRAQAAPSLLVREKDFRVFSSGTDHPPAFWQPPQPWLVSSLSSSVCSLLTNQRHLVLCFLNDSTVVPKNMISSSTPESPELLDNSTGWLTAPNNSTAATDSVQHSPPTMWLRFLPPSFQTTWSAALLPFSTHCCRCCVRDSHRHQ
jgi:hypothetical protein